MLLWKLESVTLHGRGRPRLDDVSLEIRPGVTAVVGYSGAGKTSLLNLLVEFERPDRGNIRRFDTAIGAFSDAVSFSGATGGSSASAERWDDVQSESELAKPELRRPSFPTRSLGTRENRLPVFWVPPGDGLWPHLTVLDHLQAVAPSHGRQQIDAGLAILEQFDLADKHNEHPDRLSQGECTRLAVARALASGAAVLVMDEPLVHVDSARLGKYWDAVRNHCLRTETSLIIATHSPETVLREADDAVCLNAGRLEYSGSVDELYYRPSTPQLAAYLGPANWLTADDAVCWLGESQNDRHCFRPEQIEVSPSSDGRFVVQASRFVGSHAEVELRDEQSGRSRRFVHRPSGDRLRIHDRVAIGLRLMLLACLLSVAGCDSQADVQLPVKNVTHWAMPAADRRIPAPRSMLAVEGEVYVLDNAGRVLVFDETGQVSRQWRMPDYDVGKPEGLYLLRDGRLAVADTHYHRVVYFDRNGKVHSMHGELGTEPGQFIYPVAVGQDDDENIYVCEYGTNDRIQKFTVDGKFLLEFGSFGVEPGQFQRPSGMVWHAGKVYVADAINNRIQVFSDSGEFLEILDAQEGSAALHYPYDIAIGPDSHLYVVEYGAGRISQFDLSGKLLGRFGSTGWGEGQFSTPWGLTVDSRRRVYVADTGNRRIVEIEL